MGMSLAEKAAVPSLNGKASTEEISRYNVRHCPVRESNGIIYVWYGDTDRATDELPFFYEDLDSSYVYSEIEDHCNSHYSRCIENQLMWFICLSYIIIPSGVEIKLLLMVQRLSL